MDKGLKVLRKSPFQKLTVVASALALMSGCSSKMITGQEVKAEVLKTKTNEQNKTQKNGENSSKPNIVYIVLDDSGFSDIGSYGSEIKTPNLDWLAENGLRYNNSHVTPVCSPTRASLLTGRNPHDIGMSTVANFDMGPDYPNKRGRIYPEAGTIAEVLNEYGYNNYALGKWHLAPAHQVTPAGPYENWPLGKGFDRFYGFLEDSGDQYRPELIQDNSPVDVPKKENYHFSEDIVDRADQYVTDQVSVNPDKPFFLYLSFGAQHQPVQVPQKYIDMYKGVYDKGWDKIREDRFNKQKELGIIPKDTKLTGLNPGVKPWVQLSDEEKKVFVRFQEAYAGFLTHTDEQIGRFIHKLSSLGELDNTMIVFLSDNGTSSMGKNTGSINHTLPYNDVPEKLADVVKHIDDIGSDRAGAEFPTGWAQVSNTPFKFYKATTFEAGVHTPLIIYYPKKIKDKGGIRKQYLHVSDITPTVYDVLGIDLPKEINGVKQMPLQGKSFADTFDNPKASGRDVQYYENNGQRAIYEDGWKAVALHKSGDPYENDNWQLYHTAEDFSETQDLAAKYPKKLKELQALWEKEARKYGVFPMTDIAGNGFLTIPSDSNRAKNSFTFYPGMSRLSEAASPFIINRSYSITIPINRNKASDDGVLLALGGYESGYTLYIKNKKLIYEYNMGNAVYRIQSNSEVPTGPSTIRYDFTKTEANKGIGHIFINGQEVGEGTIEHTHQYKIAFEGLDIGKDTLYPVSSEYKDEGEFKFTGEIEKVIYQLN
ncbi:arylsulfatase [Neobacillus drentensis]|uniref:arylsulfatase n=1 Tax=Neobacillus drentensis TaxID=220684 RepID=UPI001F2354A1|nr:arylsulfatase [Neobacillus drentensis]ULT58638.1 arylsulfatase [Neobacillus drentensis]